MQKQNRDGKRKDKTMRQIAFGFLQDYKKEFGGTLLEGKRKTRRPISTKHPLHVILKSLVRGVFKPHNTSLDHLIRSQAKKFNIDIYDLALNWNHIHMVLRVYNRKNYVRFIRSLTSILAEKIRAVRPDLEEIFTLRPFSRVVSWGRDFKYVLAYQVLNQLEAWGLVKREMKVKKSCKKTNGKSAKAPMGRRQE